MFVLLNLNLINSNRASRIVTVSTCFVLFIMSVSTSRAQDQPEKRQLRYADDNHQCLKCHGHQKYFYYNDWTERMVKENMNPYFVIDSAAFYESNHWDFRCIDCHSDEYDQFPHPGELRMEYKYTCLDCHGEDEDYASFHFESIEEEFYKSVHSTRHDADFTCWMCHDAHAYKISYRSDLSLPEIIRYDNEICLSCHANTDKYQLLTEQENPGIIESHGWLPNQERHFRRVRCIECHAEQNEEILVAHNIQTKDKAVRSCVECHSENSMLYSTLFKYRRTENRERAGFRNAIFLMEETYVMGANRNRYLNKISTVIFIVTLAAIAVHLIFRIIYKTG
jgi:hypothetical protein